MDISIVIVNYKSKGLTLGCIKSIREADWSGLSYEIIVVDNNSNDHLGDILNWQYPEIKFVQAGANLGMGSGNNLGLSQATGKYFVVMNPDTLAQLDTFQVLFRYMEANELVGGVGPKQFNPDRSVQSSCFRWPSLLIPIYRRTFIGSWRFARRDLNRYLMTDFDHDRIIEVDWLLGSFFFVRAEAYQKVGGFDERFFLYFEDIDLCRRLHQAGWKLVYNPDATIIHNHNRESAKTAWYKFFTSPTTRAHVVSWIKYLNKWNFK